MARRANNSSKAKFQGNNAVAGARLKKGGVIVSNPTSGSISRVIERVGLDSVEIRNDLTANNIIIGTITHTSDYDIRAGIIMNLLGPIAFTGTVIVDGTLNIF